MDPLHFLTDEELIRFFHCKKTEMSLMQEPQTFLNQLRDHNLVQENLYYKVIKMKSKERRQHGVYQILDKLEKAECVRRFWGCVFQDHMLHKYHVLSSLRNSLLDGSFKYYVELPAEEEPSKDKEESVQKEEKMAKDKKAGKKRKKSVEETEDEQPGHSSCSTPKQQNPGKKLKFYSPLKKGEKLPIWTWPIFKNHLPVTCGNKEGTLHHEKLARGKKCILSDSHWFTPGEFERYAGRGSSKNWKLSIRCQNTPLQKLIEDGHLQAPCAKRRCIPKCQKLLFPAISSESSSSSDSISSSESFSHTFSEEMEESCEDQEEQNEMSRVQEDDEDDEEEEESDPVDLSLFEGPSLPVSCGSVSGVLCKQRFTGLFTKSIRTEEGWFTPEEFVKQVLTDGLWKKDILCHGKTIYYLTMKKILYVHSVNCQCDRCCQKTSLDQNNDDVCFICNSGGELVCCDGCPRAFHESCHLPEANTSGDDWMCTFCIFKTYQGSFLPMTQQAALDSLVSRNTMRCEYLLLCMYKVDEQRVFTEDPRTTMENYSRVISNPMWLDRVKMKLKIKRYKTVREFVADIRLIFQNCTIFNKDNEFGRMGSRLSEIFESDFQKVFKIH